MGVQRGGGSVPNTFIGSANAPDLRGVVSWMCLLAFLVWMEWAEWVQHRLLGRFSDASVSEPNWTYEYVELLFLERSLKKVILRLVAVCSRSVYLSTSNSQQTPLPYRPCKAACIYIGTWRWWPRDRHSSVYCCCRLVSWGWRSQSAHVSLVNYVTAATGESNLTSKKWREAAWLSALKLLKYGGNQRLATRSRLGAMFMFNCAIWLSVLQMRCRCFFFEWDSINVA